ncbi:MAG: carboxylating nicotinate-nucleotide diphosphorylase [Planctomycetes bacterium]|nr:carboxylating nicotinate-nucleotide diphosphorylase [Planctomycetota bacterium]
MKGLPVDRIRPLVRMAVDEDQGPGDVTSALLHGEESSARAALVAREPLVLCGWEVAREVLAQYHPQLALTIHIADGGQAAAGQSLGLVEGPLVPMLAAERVVLNFLQRLSGIATLTQRYVEQIQGTQAKVFDTRKTTPGWRLLEKYAVRCGGGNNHRMGLYDAVLVKDNHLAQWGDQWIPKLEALVVEAATRASVQFVEVEVDDLDQFKAVLGISGIDIILLDNMDEEQLTAAVSLRDEAQGSGPPPLLEASGAITLERIASVARTGVDRIAVGAITHAAVAVDIGMDWADP